MNQKKWRKIVDENMFYFSNIIFSSSVVVESQK